MRQLHMGKILGVDYGTKNTGIAVSDELGTIAAAHSTIVAGNDRNLSQKLKKLISEVGDIDLIIYGAPLGLDSKPTRMSQMITDFAQNFETETGIPFKLWNETYSSQIAESTKVHKNTDLHAKSAQVILQEFLDFRQTGI